MKKKILILGSSSFSGASMVNFLLNKKKYLIYGTYRRKKGKPYLPYLNNKNQIVFDVGCFRGSFTKKLIKYGHKLEIKSNFFLFWCDI